RTWISTRSFCDFVQLISRVLFCDLILFVKHAIDEAPEGFVVRATDAVCIACAEIGPFVDLVDWKIFKDNLCARDLANQLLQGRLCLFAMRTLEVTELDDRHGRTLRSLLRTFRFGVHLIAGKGERIGSKRNQVAYEGMLPVGRGV